MKKKTKRHSFSAYRRTEIRNWLKRLPAKANIAKAARPQLKLMLEQRYADMKSVPFAAFLQMVYRENTKLAKAKKTTVKRVVPKGNTSARESQAQSFIAERGAAKAKKQARKMGTKKNASSISTADQLWDATVADILKVVEGKVRALRLQTDFGQDARIALKVGYGIVLEERNGRLVPVQMRKRI